MTETSPFVLAEGSPWRRGIDASFALVPFLERSLLEWASDEFATIAAGDWQDGAVMELVGETRLLPRLNVADCEALRRALEERPVPSSHALPAAARLRQWLGIAEPSRMECYK